MEKTEAEKNAAAPAFGFVAGNFVHRGLSKKEYFAAVALQGLLANPNQSLSIEYLTGRAVDCAEALLDELDRRK